jgi:K+-transporting ATPase ATPase C chain
MKSLFLLFRQATASLLVLTVVTGVAYPLVVTIVAQTVFPYQSNGSIRIEGGNLVASELIGQSFASPGYFWGRPSATSPLPYTPFDGVALTGSTGSNLGPLNPALQATIKDRVAALRTANPAQSGPVPVDLVTASGSGLDPHISPAAAEYQVARVASARGISENAVRNLVAQHTERRQLGVLGEPRVNVLMLNHALNSASKSEPGR